jgi:hypothetical protein
LAIAVALPPSPLLAPPLAFADDDASPEPLDVAVLLALASPPAPLPA